MLDNVFELAFYFVLAQRTDWSRDLEPLPNAQRYFGITSEPIYSDALKVKVVGGWDGLAHVILVSVPVPIGPFDLGLLLVLDWDWVWGFTKKRSRK